MVLEKDIESRKRFCMIILKNNQISIVQDKLNRNFERFKHNTSIGVVRNIIFKISNSSKIKL